MKCRFFRCVAYLIVCLIFGTSNTDQSSLEKYRTAPDPEPVGNSIHIYRYRHGQHLFCVQDCSNNSKTHTGSELKNLYRYRYRYQGPRAVSRTPRLAMGDRPNSPLKMPLTISCLNCNSLNLSVTSAANRNQKINGITKLGSDIILLSDVRLGNKNLISSASEVKKLFEVNLHYAYEFYYNSSKNKRGVGILIKKDLNIIVQENRRDIEENLLLLRVDLKGEQLIVGAVYGPNHNYPAFFDNIKNEIRAISGNNPVPVCLGGDWNCTYSTDPVDINIDTLNMMALPNLTHSIALNQMCLELELVDPFRHLHFNKTEFTFMPRSEASKNKSRIDFFLVSESLLGSVNDCKISDTLQSKLFDHKAVKLILNQKAKIKKKGIFIANKVMASDLLDAVVYSSVAETYLHHVRPPAVFQLENMLRTVGELKQAIRNLGIDFAHRPSYHPSDEEIETRNRALQRIRYQLTVLNIPWLETLELSVDIDIFLEVLVNNIRNEVTSYQSFFLKEKRKEYTSAVSELTSLKKNYRQNDERIRLVEKKLNDIADADLRLELEQYDIFEHVSSEKMSPKFLDLAKSSKVDATLDDIKNPEGNEFGTGTERKKFIRDYFANIYKKTEGPVNPYAGCIEDFLGPEILRQPKVRAAKIPENLRQDFELPLSGAELDKAVSGLKSNSAGGPDGLSVKFVKRYWGIFSSPLVKYSEFCIQKGTLTHSFATGSVRLIPKKGDTSDIKNWRPISLLNVLYKVLSKALNNRLKKIAGSIITRSQKGFVENRYIQECLINTIEIINYANVNEIESFCLALDQKKAFDSVNHAFMTEVYKFFGFGPEFINMINVLTTGRNACLIWEDGTLSESFPLEGGHTQGNGPSPLLFDFCQQILLFKLEFCTDIISILPRRGRELMDNTGEARNQLPVPVRVPDPEPALEAAPAHALIEAPGPILEGANPIMPRAVDPEQGIQFIKDDKVETFADDATLLARATREAAIAIKQILMRFYELSGLQCNFEKTTIMFFGTNDNNVPDWVQELGVQVVTKTKILGCEIEKDLSKISSNFDNTLVKIRNIKNFWSRFNLSLPGRLAVAKTLMLSQINYLGCFLTPTEQQIQSMYLLVSDFIKGRANISKDRIFFRVEHGGLGMIDIRSYITSQQCAWFKRLNNGNADTYKEILLDNGYGNLGAAEPDRITVIDNPVLANLCGSFNKFYNAFLRINNNWKKSSVLYNPLLRNANGKSVVNDQFLRHNLPPLSRDNVSQLTVGMLWSNGRLNSLDEINEHLPVQLSLVSYMRLAHSSQYWDKRAIRPNTSVHPGIKVSQFLGGFKKGSRPIRNVLDSTINKKSEKYGSKLTKSFVQCCELENLDLGDSGKYILEWWSHHFIGNRMRDFLFKYVSNTLNINSRLAHFVANRDQSCTFCSMNGQRPIARESFEHLFFSCPVVDNLHVQAERQFWPEIAYNSNQDRKILWLCGLLNPATEVFNLFLQVLVGTINFYIWECKIKKSCTSWDGCKTFCYEKIETMLAVSSKLRSSREKLNISFFRRWRDG
jgi:exonuclease III